MYCVLCFVLRGAQPEEMIRKHETVFSRAMTAYNEKKRIWDDINVDMLARPVWMDDDAAVAAGGAAAATRAAGRRVIAQEQMMRWHSAIAFEKRNKQEVDAVQVMERVRLVYKQALNCCRFMPDLWYVGPSVRTTAGSALSVYLCML